MIKLKRIDELGLGSILLGQESRYLTHVINMLGLVLRHLGAQTCELRRQP